MFPTWNDRVYNVTRTVSNQMGDTWFQCLMSGWVQYNWTMEYIEQFDVENKTYSYPVSALQSMLSQVVLLARYNDELDKA